MAPMYYRRANAALIVYDITREQSFDEAKEWVKGQCLSIPFHTHHTDTHAHTHTNIEFYYLSELESKVDSNLCKFIVL